MIEIDRWKTADLARFPDDDDLRYEIIDGELHVTKAPDTYHQVVAGRIAAALDAWSTANTSGLAVAAPGIILEDEDNIIPDAIWISSARLSTALQSDGKLHTLPDLVVEVLSPGAANIRRDREKKPVMYAHNGVLEYWIVDWPRRQVEVYRYDGANLQPVETLSASETLQTPLLPGFAQPIAPLFAGLPHD
jgi:Uma2 family endonuclease